LDQGKKIIVLEPRRVAARAAAERMAELLGESVGSSTPIEVVIEGVVTRMLQDDPALESAAIVIFDEFHVFPIAPKCFDSSQRLC